MPDMVSNVLNRWMNRFRYRRNSIAECQGSKAKVVHHMYQKFVVKNSWLKQSEMRLPFRWDSGVATHLTSSSRSRSENPIEWALAGLPAESIRRALSFQAKSS